MAPNGKFLLHPVGAFREKLENMTSIYVCLASNIEYFCNELSRYLLVEQVPHRLHKDSPGLAPVQRLIQNLLIETKTLPVKQIFIVTSVAESQIDFLRVAMQATGAYLCTHPTAARTIDAIHIMYRIPGEISPGYFSGCHS